MTKQFYILIFLLLIGKVPFAQTSLDTLFFQDGKVEAVQITGITDVNVEYNFYGEGIAISTPKSKLIRVKTRSGRIVEFETTSIKKTVFTCEDWEKVTVTAVDSEVKDMIRNGNVSGKAKGITVYSQAGKMQDRAMNKMKMQAAFRGCDVVYLLNQQVEGAEYGYYSSKTAEANLSGTAYSAVLVSPINLTEGEYLLDKVYVLNPNEYELALVPYNPNITQVLQISKDIFVQEGVYFATKQHVGIPDCNNTFYLLSYDDSKIVFLVIQNSNQSKMAYYNLFYSKVR